MTRVLLYVAGRLAGAVVTVLAGALVVFVLIRLGPGDPALAALGDSAVPEAVAAFRAKHGLDPPLPPQSFPCLKRLLPLDSCPSLTITRPRSS